MFCVRDFFGRGGGGGANLHLGELSRDLSFFTLQFGDPEMLSSESYTVSKSSEVSRVGGASVRFYGKQLCVAVTQVTEVERHDGIIDRSSSCQKSCLDVGGGTRLEIYSGSFGRPSSTNPPCCFWGRTKTLRFSIPAPPTTPPATYECIKCSGDDCDGEGAESSTETCRPGEKCFTLKLQKKKTSEVVTVKGCSHVLRYWGKKLDCDYQCKNNVPLDPEYRDYHYSVCVSCCSGNTCNRDIVSSGAGSNRIPFLRRSQHYFSLRIWRYDLTARI